MSSKRMTAKEWDKHQAALDELSAEFNAYFARVRKQPEATDFQKEARLAAQSDFSAIMSKLDTTSEWAIKSALSRAFHYGEYIGRKNAVGEMTFDSLLVAASTP